LRTQEIGGPARRCGGGIRRENGSGKTQWQSLLLRWYSRRKAVGIVSIKIAIWDPVLRRIPDLVEQTVRQIIEQTHR
jgi:hypothetical protein